MIAATIVILTAVPVADGRVFGGRVPDGHKPHMPRACVSVRASGGGTSAAHRMKTGSQRIDIKSYGGSDYEAGRVDAAVAAALQAWTSGVVTVDDPDDGEILVKVGSFTQIGGPNQLEDPDTEWPFTLSVWQAWGDRYTGGAP